jgi:hypothetical protein
VQDAFVTLGIPATDYGPTISARFDELARKSEMTEDELRRLVEARDIALSAAQYGVNRQNRQGIRSGFFQVLNLFLAWFAAALAATVFASLAMKVAYGWSLGTWLSRIPWVLLVAAGLALVGVFAHEQEGKW